MTPMFIPELVLGFLFGVAFITTAAIILTPHSDPLWTLLWTPEAAGWGQVIGTIGAILAAAWIAGWQQRKTLRLSRERELRRAKAAAGYIVPILKIIQFDVKHLIECSQMVKSGASVRTLKGLRYEFRPLPSIQFVLENADSLPGDSNLAVPQLLSLRELAANDIRILLDRHAPDGQFSSAELNAILKWLEMMKTLVDELFDELKSIHDDPIGRLLWAMKAED
jgi:hypothetical protein